MLITLLHFIKEYKKKKSTIPTNESNTQHSHPKNKNKNNTKLHATLHYFVTCPQATQTQHKSQMYKHSRTT